MTGIRQYTQDRYKQPTCLLAPLVWIHVRLSSCVVSQAVALSSLSLSAGGLFLLSQAQSASELFSFLNKLQLVQPWTWHEIFYLFQIHLKTSLCLVCRTASSTAFADSGSAVCVSEHDCVETFNAVLQG